MSKTTTKPRHNGTIKPAEELSPVKNGRSQSCSPLKRFKPSGNAEAAEADGVDPSTGTHVDSDDAELARKLHEQLNGPDSPTAAPITRHITRVRRAPTFYKPEQPRGYGGYHGVDGAQEAEDGSGEASPHHAKESHLPRELRRLHDHSMSLSDSEGGKSTHPGGPRRTRASSVPHPANDSAQARRPLATQSADQGGKKRSDMKTEEDTDTHSRSSAGQQRRKQHSKTPELRLTRSMQPPQELHPNNPPANERRTGKSLPVKLEQQGAAGEAAALHQGSSGSPGKATAGSGSQQNGAAKRRGSKGLTVKQGDAAVKPEVSSSRLRQSAAGASTSGESQSHIDLAAACHDQADAVGSSGRGGGDSAAAGVSKRAKLPAKNPMVLQKQNGSYYRVRVLKEELHRVKIEFMGFEQQLQPVWLARDSERIWRGSYKNKAWKHLGDGAWEPKSGEKRIPVVAHGTHQNQYTKRRALLNSISNNASSNNDSDDNAGSSEDGTKRDRQHGHFAETGFAAEASGQPQGGEEDKEGAQNADSHKAEDALPIGESGVLSRQQVDDSSGRHKGSSDESKKGQRRRKHKPRDADASSAENASRMTIDALTLSTQPSRRKGSSALMEGQPGKVKSSVHAQVAAVVVTDALPSSKSGLLDERQSGGAGPSMEMRDTAPDAAVDQFAKASKDVDSAVQPVTGPSRDSKAGTDNMEAATSSGMRHGKAEAAAMGSRQKTASGKAQSGLEAALQCEEHLADDASASPVDAAAAAKAGKASDDKPKAATEAEAAPKPLAKPRRDRKGRIRGTYGINAKPAEVQTPAESPPAPGVTRASLRPKPAAKASPEDEQSEGAKPAVGLRHARAPSGGPDVSGPVPESPGSPQHSKGSVPEVRRPNGRSAIQRRAAAANFAVAAAVAAEAADALPPSRDHLSRPSPKLHHTHRRPGSFGAHKTSLDRIRSGRITKTVSGGSSGGGSSGGGSARFSSLMDALGEMEAREGSFKQQQAQQAQQQEPPPCSGPGRSTSLGERSALANSGGGPGQRPALFDRGSNGYLNRWHEPVGPISPRILTLSPELFQLSSSSFTSDGWPAPSFCHTSFHAGVQPQFPLFKSRECAG